MLFLTKDNFKEHCRTCLTELTGSTDSSTTVCNLDDLPDTKNLKFSICNDPELQQLISINIDGPCTSDAVPPVVNDFPENICLDCYNKLYSFAVFRRRAQQSAEKLRTVLNSSDDIKVEINFEEGYNETKRDESVAPQECKFQLHDATAETEQTFFDDTAVTNTTDEAVNDHTVDPFSPSAPSPPLPPSPRSESVCSDRDMVDSEVEEKPIEERLIEGKPIEENNVVEKQEVKKAKRKVGKTRLSKITRKQKTETPKVVTKCKYRCPQCNQDFIKNAELTEHVNQVHALGSTPFLCDHCDKSYRNLRSLKEHVVNSHQDVIKSQVHFQCTECEKAFLDNRSLKIHTGLHFTDKKTRVCEICSERFPVKKWLVEHLRTHTPDGRIPCSQCDKTYSRHADLENHERSAHLKEKPHHCKICNKSFQNKQSFRIHNYRHTGKKPYLCDICGKDFRQRTAMKTHRSSHFKNDLKK